MFKLPVVDIDNPARTFGRLTDEQKKRGAKAIKESIKRTKWITKTQNDKKYKKNE